jgi:hypothetical protein
MRFVRLCTCLLLSALVASPLAAVTRHMFLTSVTGTGNLSSWPDAGGFAGLDAADAICQARATAAGLANAAAYRAWISDSVDDAYCRMHNLGGKRATNCGEPTLPAAAGPWWRTDGKPFGAGLPDLLAPLEQVLNPPSVNEFGVDLQVGAAWTATGLQGVAGPATCLNWTSTASPDPVYDGSAHLTSGSWTFSGSSNCSSSVQGLYCFETGTGDPLPAFPAWGRLAFATSAEGTGNLGSWPAAAGATGLAAGDAICRNLASAAGLRDSSAFKAWLSIDGTNASGRFQHDGPWMRLDGIVVAESRLDLTDGVLDSPINRTETGLYLGNVGTWTGTLATGSAAPANCANWTSTSGTGELGSANSVVSGWTENGGMTCGFAYAYLYCLQDLPLVFHDGFESAGTQAWTVTVN